MEYSAETYLPGPRPQQLEARKLFVCGCVPEFDQPLRKADLRSYACDRAGVDALLERIDEAVHQSNERGRVSLSDAEGERRDGGRCCC